MAKQIHGDANVENRITSKALNIPVWVANFEYKVNDNFIENDIEWRVVNDHISPSTFDAASIDITNISGGTSTGTDPQTAINTGGIATLETEQATQNTNIAANATNIAALPNAMALQLNSGANTTIPLI
jgi:hypothetical protein